MSIEVIKYKPYVKGSMRGFFDIYVDKLGLEIYGCSLFGKGNQHWVNLPSREWKDESGETKYLNVVRFRNEEHFKAFKQAALDAVMQYCRDNGINPDQAQAPAAPAPQAAAPAPSDEGLPF